MSTTTIHVRVNEEVKEKASNYADRVGIPLSSLINAFLVRFAETGRLPFDIAVQESPNDLTRAAVRELNDGGGSVY
ncbi:MAG: type II toxin-antitoxin system RelB/DinJ family antitoxin, partial [Cloacibacillus sp.]